ARIVNVATSGASARYRGRRPVRRCPHLRRPLQRGRPARLCRVDQPGDYCGGHSGDYRAETAVEAEAGAGRCCRDQGRRASAPLRPLRPQRRLAPLVGRCPRRHSSGPRRPARVRARRPRDLRKPARTGAVATASLSPIGAFLRHHTPGPPGAAIPRPLQPGPCCRDPLSPERSGRISKLRGDRRAPGESLSGVGFRAPHPRPGPRV
ncbi:MAG: hypothetical protein RL033_111, partial [Pseudomonadota bacterium]